MKLTSSLRTESTKGLEAPQRRRGINLNFLESCTLGMDCRIQGKLSK